MQYTYAPRPLTAADKADPVRVLAAQTNVEMLQLLGTMDIVPTDGTDAQDTYLNTLTPKELVDICLYTLRVLAVATGMSDSTGVVLMTQALFRLSLLEPVMDAADIDRAKDLADEWNERGQG